MSIYVFICHYMSKAVDKLDLSTRKFAKSYKYLLAVLKLYGTF